MKDVFLSFIILHHYSAPTKCQPFTAMLLGFIA